MLWLRISATIYQLQSPKVNTDSLDLLYGKYNKPILMMYGKLMTLMYQLDELKGSSSPPAGNLFFSHVWMDHCNVAVIAIVK